MRARPGHRIARAAATAAAVALLGPSCDDEPPPNGENQIRYCEFELQFPYGDYAVLLTGDTGRLIPRTQAAGGLTGPGTATEWSSSNPGVAQVDATGLVTGAFPGVAEISADGCIGFSVEVVARPVTIDMAPDTLRMLPGNRGYLQYVARDAAGVEMSNWFLTYIVRLTSSDSRVVMVDADPAYPSVSATGDGAATIRARIGDATGTMAVIVTSTTLGVPLAGSDHTCAISADSLAYCWGNTFSVNPPRYGPGDLSGPAPVALPLSLRFATLVSGGGYACGLTPDGALYCIGDNFFGQLGAGVNGAVAGAVAVMAGTRFRSVSAGAAHACAVTSDGRVFCWGINIAGELGQSTDGGCFAYVPKGGPVSIPCSPAPVPAAPELTFASVRAGPGLTCGRTTGGDTYCWGLHYGPNPVLADGGLDLDTMDVGGMSYLYIAPTTADTVTLACGLDPAGAAFCWGKSRYGLGDGSTTESWTPVAVAGGITFRALSVGLGACGVSSDGGVYCWGGPPSGFASGATPARVPGTQTFASVSAGSSHACGLGTDGRVYCWGSNAYSQLGVPGDYHASPVRVPGQR